MADVIELGTFTVGEVPPPLEYQFLHADGTPIDLTGYAVRFQKGLATLGGLPSNVDETAGTLSSAVDGKVEYVWDADDLSLPGRHVGVFWVGNGTNRYASCTIEWVVCRAPAAAPAI